MTILETERLQLRLWKEKDFEQFAQYYADENNAKYVGGQKNNDDAWRHFALQRALVVVFISHPCYIRARGPFDCSS